MVTPLLQRPDLTLHSGVQAAWALYQHPLLSLLHLRRLPLLLLPRPLVTLTCLNGQIRRSAPGFKQLRPGPWHPPLLDGTLVLQGRLLLLPAHELDNLHIQLHLQRFLSQSATKKANLNCATLPVRPLVTQSSASAGIQPLPMDRNISTKLLLLPTYRTLIGK